MVAGGLAGIGFLWSEKLHRDDQSSLQNSLETYPSPAAIETDFLTPVAVPVGQPESSSIKQAMARCDAEAAENPDGLYFLLTPVVPINFESATLLLPPGKNYKYFFLVTSSQVLNGLDEGSLGVSMRPYQFSLLNSETNQITNWKPVIGPSQFTQSNVAWSKFQIKLDLADTAVTWTDEYNRQRGSCYWINVFFPHQTYSPHSGRVNVQKHKSFPSQARTIRCANHMCELDSEP
jgi:hypothetical protein